MIAPPDNLIKKSFNENRDPKLHFYFFWGGVNWLFTAPRVVIIPHIKIGIFLKENWKGDFIFF